VGAPRKTVIKHVGALDGARGAAVVAVLLFHARHLTGGYLGVDLFFTLSGYLITTLLLTEIEQTGGVGLGGFWARRARRLLPALAGVLVGVALYCWHFGAPEQFTQIRGDAFATLGYVANWREVFAHHDYWALFRAPSPLNHTWSLAIEEQFYLAWPLIVVGLLAWRRRATPKAVLITALALAGLSSVLMIVLYDELNVARVYYGTDTRAASILWGAALAAGLAVWGPPRGRGSRIVLEILGIGGAIGLLVAWTRLDGQSSLLFRGGFLLCGLAATAVIAAVVHPTPGPLARVLAVRPLRFLGLISYGVYLWHWPVDVFLDRSRMGFDGWALVGVQTAVTLTIAVVSYFVIEQPIRRGALTAVQWRAIVPAVAVVLVAVVVASTLGARDDVGQVALTDPVGVARRMAKDAPPSATRVMIVGNSVAFDLGQSMQRLRTTPPLAVFNAAQVACTFPHAATRLRIRLPDGTTETQPTIRCHPSWETSVVKAFRPAVIFWVMGDPLRTGIWYAHQWLEPCTAPYDALYTRSLRREVALLGVTGAEVVITTAAYTLSFPPPPREPTDCDNRLRRAVARETGARLVDLQGYICPHGECRTEQDRVALRPDGLHYQGPGGELVARWLLEQARSAK
jgi:peptidoglycan/LPS O-acetylase OafA/YrhL